MLCKKTRDGKDTSSTERLCYECWASKEVSLSPEGFLQAQKKPGARGGTHAIFYEENAWAFLIGTCGDALGGLQEQPRMTPEGRQAEKPWDRNCDADTLR